MVSRCLHSAVALLLLACLLPSPACSKAVQSGFAGVLFSDDMHMEAIRAYYGLQTAIKRALLAGVDVLVFANNSVYDREVVPAAVQIIRGLVDSGVVSEARIGGDYACKSAGEACL